MKLKYSIARVEKYVDSILLKDNLYIGALIVKGQKCVRFVKALQENSIHGSFLQPFFESQVFLYEEALNLNFGSFENVFLVRHHISSQQMLDALRQLKY